MEPVLKDHMVKGGALETNQKAMRQFALNDKLDSVTLQKGAFRTDYTSVSAGSFIPKEGGALKIINHVNPGHDG